MIFNKQTTQKTERKANFTRVPLEVEDQECCCCCCSCLSLHHSVSWQHGPLHFPCFIRRILEKNQTFSEETADGCLLFNLTMGFWQKNCFLNFAWRSYKLIKNKRGKLPEIIRVGEVSTLEGKREKFNDSLKKNKIWSIVWWWNKGTVPKLGHKVLVWWVCHRILVQHGI